MRRQTDLIVIHCSATRPSMDLGLKEIDSWHRARGFVRVGYHFIIRRDGTVETGREEWETGAHVRNHNSHSVGVCMVGGVSEDDVKVPENNFTDEQWVALEHVVGKILQRYPGCVIRGHYELDAGKACPSFDVPQWVDSKGFPTPIAQDPTRPWPCPTCGR